MDEYLDGRDRIEHARGGIVVEQCRISAATGLVLDREVPRRSIAAWIDGV